MSNKSVQLDAFDLSGRQFPKVVLVGNGISLACIDKSNSISGAEGIVEKTAKDNNCVYRFADIKTLPFPMQFIVASKDDNKNLSIKDLSKRLSSEGFYENADWSIAKQIISLDADAILTTNYSYEFETALDSSFLRKRDKYSRFTEKTVTKKGNARREGKYQLHSFYQFNRVNTKPIRVWHIHGEANNYSSIVIGHDMYGNLLSKYQEELSRWNRQNKDRTQTELITPYSWIDYFIYGDVFVIGFSLSESEFDLWWLLNRKKQEKLPHGKTYFFDKDGENIKMRMLFDAFDVKEITTNCRDYKDHYQETVSIIKSGYF